jgi:hypothetical protein
MRARSSFPWLAAIAWTAHAAPADAAPSPASRTSSLSWVRSEGADGCTGGKELAGAVEAIVGRRVFVSASAADVAVEGRIDRTDAGWKATLRISDEGGAVLGSRELTSPASDCRAMDGSLALVIAVMIDPDAASRPLPPVARPVAPASPPREAPPSPSARWSIAPRLGVSAAFGELPAPAWGATMGLRIGPPAVGVEVFGSLFLPQTITVPTAPGASARFTWADAGVALCPSLASASTVSLAVCAGAAGGVRTATPRSGLEDEQGSSSFVALGVLRARLAWQLTPLLFALADGGADVPFERPDWTATSASGAMISVFRPSVVGGAAGVSVGLRLE